MLRILGTPIGDEDARSLIATLIAEGSPGALTAAGQITKGVDRELYAVGLTREERTAVLCVLDDPPEGLAELRGVLMREHVLQPPGRALCPPHRRTHAGICGVWPGGALTAASRGGSKAAAPHSARRSIAHLTRYTCNLGLIGVSSRAQRLAQGPGRGEPGPIASSPCRQAERLAPSRR